MSATSGHRIVIRGGGGQGQGQGVCVCVCVCACACVCVCACARVCVSYLLAYAQCFEEIFWQYSVWLDGFHHHLVMGIQCSTCLCGGRGGACVCVCARTYAHVRVRIIFAGICPVFRGNILAVH